MFFHMTRTTTSHTPQDSAQLGWGWGMSHFVSHRFETCLDITLFQSSEDPIKQLGEILNGWDVADLPKAAVLEAPGVPILDHSMVGSIVMLTNLKRSSKASKVLGIIG